MEYVSLAYYVADFLLGKKPKLPPSDFAYWEKSARRIVDYYTFNRITPKILEEHKNPISQCVCELAEFLYMNEGSENKVNESVAGRSTSYIVGYDYDICAKHLMGTGLMYRGGGSV